MKDLLYFRVGRVCVTVKYVWPIIRFDWDPSPHLLTSFGWGYIWWKGKKWPWEKTK